MTCPSCARAHTDARCAMYHAGCRGCSIRALANGPPFFEAARAGQITPAYRTALVALLGDEDWMAGHQAVKAEHERLKALKQGG